MILFCLCDAESNDAESNEVSSFVEANEKHILKKKCFGKAFNLVLFLAVVIVHQYRSVKKNRQQRKKWALRPGLGNRVIHKDFYVRGRYVAHNRDVRTHLCTVPKVPKLLQVKKNVLDIPYGIESKYTVLTS